MSATIKNWDMLGPRWWVSIVNPMVEIKTDCRCKKSCSFTWAVWHMDEIQTWTYRSTRAEVLVAAEQFFNELEAADV